MRPLFAKAGMVFDCEIVDTATWLERAVKNKQQLFRLRVVYHSGIGFSLEPFSPNNPFYHAAEIRDWCTIMPNGASLKNCYKARPNDREQDRCVPQSFTFMAREGGMSEGSTT